MLFQELWAEPEKPERAPEVRQGPWGSQKFPEGLSLNRQPCGSNEGLEPQVLVSMFPRVDFGIPVS